MDRPDTHFAPTERASLDVLKEQAKACLDNPVSLALLESVAGYALILNQERQIVAANPEALAALEQLSQESLCGLRVGEAFGCVKAAEGPGGCGTSSACAQCGAVLTILGSQTEQRALSGECLLSLKRGHTPVSREFLIRASPVCIANQALTLVILQDLGAQKRREALEHLVFHDFQGVLQGVDSQLTHLVKHPEGLSATAAQIQEMTLMLGEELTGQRILLNAEEGKLLVEPEEIRVPKLLSTLQARFKPQAIAEGREFLVDPGEGGMIHTDGVLLTRVLTSLLRNALEATAKGGQVLLRFARDKATCRLEVHNTGAIPPLVQHRIFQRSFSTKAARGRGLGTYSAKLFTEGFLGGRLTFTSSESDTCFTVELPLSISHSPLPDEEGRHNIAVPLPGPGGGSQTVLIVDDSPTARNVLASTLRKEHKVILASNGQEALELANRHLPDLILLDAVMPNLDGFATCARLKSDPNTEDIPVLFMSGLSGDDDETRALEAGAIDFIPKPIRPVVVAARVRNQLELKRTRDRLQELTLLDGLTGIANRRRFDRHIHGEWQRARRNKSSLAIILGDVDFFKRYNDGYGHAKGDECLQQVAKAFQSALLRPGDLAARYGGEEFVCVLPETDLSGALQVAERIRQAVKAAAMPHAHSEAAPVVSVSLGVACQLPEDGQDSSALMKKADDKLYEAKRQGRDRAVG